MRSRKVLGVAACLAMALGCETNKDLENLISSVGQKVEEDIPIPRLSQGDRPREDASNGQGARDGSRQGEDSRVFRENGQGDGQVIDQDADREIPSPRRSGGSQSDNFPQEGSDSQEDDIGRGSGQDDDTIRFRENGQGGDQTDSGNGDEINFQPENDINGEDSEDGRNGEADSGENGRDNGSEICVAPGEIGCWDSSDCCSESLQCVGNGIAGKGICAVERAILACFPNGASCSALFSGNCCSGACISGRCAIPEEL